MYIIRRKNSISRRLVWIKPFIIVFNMVEERLRPIAIRIADWPKRPNAIRIARVGAVGGGAPASITAVLNVSSRRRGAALVAGHGGRDGDGRSGGPGGRDEQAVRNVVHNHYLGGGGRRFFRAVQHHYYYYYLSARRNTE